MKNYWQGLTVTFAAVLALAVAPMTGSAQSSTDSSVYPPTANQFYAKWSAQWWKWALARPVAGHPFSDPGFNCNSTNNGQSGHVWFLASSPMPPMVERSCTIPADTAVLLGLPNVECSSLEGSPTKADQQVCATFSADHIVKSSLFCTIDGQAVANLDHFRFVSPQFTFSAPTPWIFGDTGGTGTAVSDGYFVMLKPPSSGLHTLSCGGSFHFSATDLPPSGGDFSFGNTYHLTVMEE